MVASGIQPFVLSDKHLTFRVSATHVKSMEYQVIYVKVSSTPNFVTVKNYISGIFESMAPSHYAENSVP